jgi:predicted permease
MNPFRYAARSLGRSRGFTAATTGTIALAVAAGCVVFGLVNAILLRPLPYPQSERLVGLWHTMPGINLPVVKQAPGTYVFYREAAKSFDDLGIYIALAATLTYPDRDLPPERIRLSWMTASVFSLLRARPLLGRIFADSDARGATPGVVLISERFWRTRFGADRRVLGRTLDIDGVPAQIIGVMPESFAFPEATTPVWAPQPDMTHIPAIGGFAFTGIARLRPGATIESGQRELTQILPRLAERFPQMRLDLPTITALKQTRLAPIVHPLRDDVIGGSDRVLWLAAATVALLCLVALSNVASLLLVRVEARRRELAVRSALGATAWALWKDLVAEALIVASLGGAIGFAIAALILTMVPLAAPLGLPRLNEVHVDAAIVVCALTLVTLFTLVSASLGAWRANGGDAMRLLRDGGRTGTSGRAAQRLRAALVAMEVALSLVLLASSAVLARSLLRLRAVQPGFDPANTFTFWTFLPASTYKTAPDAARFYREAIDRFRRMPGVVAVGATAKLPLVIEGFPYKILIWPDDGSDGKVLPPVVQATTTSASYFSTMRIPLIAGRTYDDANVRRGALEAVVSRSYVEQIWHDSTGRIGVGKRLRAAAAGRWFTIVGVVGDVRDSTLTQPAVPEVYFPEEPTSDAPAPDVYTTGRDMAFVIRTRAPMPGLPARLRQELHALDPALPFHRPATLEQILGDARAEMTFTLTLLAAGALVTLVLGIIGLYGVIAYVVSLRSREISIRIALGLIPVAAARMILREGAAIILAGASVGLVVYVLFARLLTTLAFEMSALDLTTLGCSLVLVLVVATMATWVPARRAAQLDPARALSAD